MELTGQILGRTATPFHAEVIRDLTEDDLLLRRVTPVGSEPRPLVKLKFQHHRLAQLIASGSGEAEASLLTGYSLSRISILKADPAFQELLAQYMKRNIEVFSDLQGRMAGFATDVLDELQDRLEVAPETYTNRELIEAVKVSNDRGGNSPIHRSQTQIAVLSASDIKAIKEEVKASESGRIIEVQKTITSDPGAALGKVGDVSPSTLVQEATLEGIES